MASPHWISLLLALYCLLWPTSVEAGNSKLEKRFPVSKGVVWTVRWCRNPYLEGRMRLANTPGSGAHWTFETVSVSLFSTPVAVFYTSPLEALLGFLNFMDRRGVWWEDDIRLLRWDLDASFVSLPPVREHSDMHAWRFYRLSVWIAPPSASYVVPRRFLRRHARLVLDRANMNSIFDAPDLWLMASNSRITDARISEIEELSRTSGPE
ncbi:hypothetical protein CP533_0082 [Ophiocordyceps camponoti-saundersi (nom. inval.)]|nr:hypothetical protein CP533_0082 [Ophiocordyceps camponoti-saundersi (nom. inval.)]